MSQGRDLTRRQVISSLGAGAAVVGAGAALAGCSKSKDAKTDEPKDKGEANKDVSPAPTAGSGKSYEWKMVTTWPKDFPGVGTGANALAAAIGTLSGGRIKVKVYGAGELVPALGVFDAVSGGKAEMGHGAAYYWKGKHEATQFFAAVPFGLTAHEMNAWLMYGGGQALWDELYAPFGLKPFSGGNTTVQMGGWFNKEIKSLDDYKGLKMRIPGLGGEVVRRLGGTPVNVPGGEIFQALKTGAIDATEWVGPYNDLAFGLHKAAKYYYWPGWHEPGTTLELMVNKKAYDALPEDLKAVVKYAAAAATLDMMAEFSARNAAALRQLIDEHKVELRQYNDDLLREVGRVAKEVVAEVAQKDPLSKKVYESFDKFRQQNIQWGHITEEGYLRARALTFA